MSENIFNQTNKKLETLSNEIGFNVPVESVSLPSKGLIYPPEHPFSNIEETEIRCMSAKDEDILTSRALIKKGNVVSELLKSCLLNKSVDVDSLLNGDRNALLVAIRVSGYGSDYSVKIECSECSEQFDNDFSLSSLKINRLGVEPVFPGQNLFNFRLPISGQDAQFKLLTGADDLILTQQAEKQKKLGSQIDNSMSRRIFQCVVSVAGETDRGKLSRIVSNLRAGDSLALRRYIDKIEPGVEMKQEAVCKHCGEAQVVDVPLGPTFFWPDFNK